MANSCVKMTPNAPCHSCVLKLYSFTTRAWWSLALLSWSMPEPSGKNPIYGITWSFSTFRNLQGLDLTNLRNLFFLDGQCILLSNKPSSLIGWCHLPFYWHAKCVMSLPLANSFFFSPFCLCIVQRGTCFSMFLSVFSLCPQCFAFFSLWAHRRSVLCSLFISPVHCFLIPCLPSVFGAHYLSI